VIRLQHHSMALRGRERAPSTTSNPDLSFCARMSLSANS
jgi:hypothetical protein